VRTIETQLRQYHVTKVGGLVISASLMIIKVGGGLEPLGPIGVYAYGYTADSRLCLIIIGRFLLHRLQYERTLRPSECPAARAFSVAGPTFLSVYLKRTCLRVTSASSALGVLDNYALYKSTHSLTPVEVVPKFKSI